MNIQFLCTNVNENIGSATATLQPQLPGLASGDTTTGAFVVPITDDLAAEGLFEAGKTYQWTVSGPVEIAA